MSDSPEQPALLARDSEGDAPKPGLARDLGELTRELHAERDVAALLQRISDSAVAEIDGADSAGISLIDRDRIRTEACTDPVIRRLDERQHRLGEGPCVTSLREEVTVRSDDLTQEQRWPRFAAMAVEAGVRSILCVQLFANDDNLGALNLFASRERAFTDDDESIAILLATHAAVAFQHLSVQSNLRVALESRDVIGQAKGILMERYKINAVDAFDLLVMVSQRANVKLRQVAEDLAATGELQLGEQPD